MKECYVCKTTVGLHKHHVFGGPNRKWSEKYNLVVYLCQYHHTGDKGVHFNKEFDLRLKQEFQTKFEQMHGHEMFMKVFGRDYIAGFTTGHERNAAAT